MNYFRLMAGAASMMTLIAMPAWAQAELSPQPNSDSELNPAAEVPPRADLLQVDPAEPLQVTDQERDQFFTPAPAPRPIEAEAGVLPNMDRLIQPPPGSQTPAQLTPGQRLSIPIR